MQTTWPFQVFCKYNDELNQILWAHSSVLKQTYANLQRTGAQWLEPASQHLIFNVPQGEEVFKNLKDWSISYNKFNSWTNLNALMALTSNLETYLATAVSLAIESDPGILFESSKSIDGVILLKQNAKKNRFQTDIITSITKGDWNSRTASYLKTFGTIPTKLTDNISELEKVRVLRNKIGHAFGRDIDGSRNHEVKDILKMETLTNDKLKKYQHMIMSTVKAIDGHLLLNHIGEFQVISYYHRILPSLPSHVHQNQRAVLLKKLLGKLGDVSGKVFCNGLVKYYEEL